jgi:hypothetical protein
MSWGQGIASRFKPGDKVHVTARYPAKGHFRTPYYIRGKTGVVERICGQYHNPEELAFGKYDGAEKVLYRVRFDQTLPRTLRPDACLARLSRESGRQGRDRDLRALARTGKVRTP